MKQKINFFFFLIFDFLYFWFDLTFFSVFEVNFWFQFYFPKIYFLNSHFSPIFFFFFLQMRRIIYAISAAVTIWFDHLWGGIITTTSFTTFQVINWNRAKPKGILIKNYNYYKYLIWNHEMLVLGNNLKLQVKSHYISCGEPDFQIEFKIRIFRHEINFFDDFLETKCVFYHNFVFPLTIWHQFFLSNIPVVISKERNKDFGEMIGRGEYDVENSVKKLISRDARRNEFFSSGFERCLPFTLYLMTTTPWSLNQDGIFGWHASFTFLYYKLTRKYFNGIKWPFSNHILNHFWY